ncbi:hypothetical protein PHK61_06260 [Actinomycetospora lutea]|uniref:hypothetical protein n=1 Tax=Actinomycetospora lutea TaxID=663604 RepID=UPI0023666E9D|nr:hypothetical protein [Actinomycetospora lutea]MDD7938020.1 hypothetical protein [Actinomycetospora lutea]
MTAPQDSGGPWLDMSRYPDTDPDAVLSPDDQGLLSAALAVDDGALPDGVWEHMLAVVTGEPTGGTDDPAADEATDDVADDPALDAGWAGEHDPHDTHDPVADDAGHDPALDDHDWDGGAV